MCGHLPCAWQPLTPRTPREPLSADLRTSCNSVPGEGARIGAFLRTEASPVHRTPSYMIHPRAWVCRSVSRVWDPEEAHWALLARSPTDPAGTHSLPRAFRGLPQLPWGCVSHLSPTDDPVLGPGGFWYVAWDGPPHWLGDSGKGPVVPAVRRDSSAKWVGSGASTPHLTLCTGVRNADEGKLRLLASQLLDVMAPSVPDFPSSAHWPALLAGRRPCVGPSPVCSKDRATLQPSANEPLNLSPLRTLASCVHIGICKDL